MKNKVICPDCGYVCDIVEFLERLEQFSEEATIINCASCYEKIYIIFKNISFQTYTIDLQTGDRIKDFMIRTYNKHDSNRLAVEVKGDSWSKVKDFEKEPSESEFKEAVEELKKEVTELAERYYSYNLKSIQKIKEGLK